jgi:hypothetical protein
MLIDISQVNRQAEPNTLRLTFKAEDVVAAGPDNYLGFPCHCAVVKKVNLSQEDYAKALSGNPVDLVAIQKAVKKAKVKAKAPKKLTAAEKKTAKTLAKAKATAKKASVKAKTAAKKATKKTRK